MTSTDVENPRAVMGNNAPDFARDTAHRLEQDYNGTRQTVASLLDEARALPKEIDNDETLGVFGRLIKRIRDLGAQIEAYRTKEKEEYLRRGNAVDGFFNGLNVKLFRAKKNDVPGAGDVLQDRVNRYMAEKEAAERRIREEAERVAREAAQKAERERLEAERKAREAEATAARARNAQKIEEANKIAEQAKREAAEATAKAEETRAAHSDAKADAVAKPADLARRRLDDGVLVTAKPEWVVEIEDAAKLDPVALWPFVKDDAKLAALKSWAKITQHKKEMAGAIITQRIVAPVR